MSTQDMSSRNAAITRVLEQENRRLQAANVPQLQQTFDHSAGLVASLRTENEVRRPPQGTIPSQTSESPPSDAPKRNRAERCTLSVLGNPA